MTYQATHYMYFKTPVVHTLTPFNKAAHYVCERARFYGALFYQKIQNPKLMTQIDASYHTSNASIANDKACKAGSILELSQAKLNRAQCLHWASQATLS